MVGLLTFYFWPALKTEFNLQIARRSTPLPNNAQREDFNSKAVSDQVKYEPSRKQVKYEPSRNEIISENLKMIEPQKKNERIIVRPFKPEKRQIHPSERNNSNDQKTRYQNESMNVRIHRTEKKRATKG